MIDEKKIEEAAEEFAQLKRDYYDEYYPIKKGFKFGVRWFKKNLWHDASEEPNKDLMFTYILCETDKGYDVCDGYLAKLLPIGEHWEDFVNRNFVTHWLYIEDLMKGWK